MELKVIIYIIGGILYFLYQRSKSQEKDNSTLPPQKKKKSLFDEVMDEINKASNPPKEILKPVAKPTFGANTQKVTKGKDLFITEHINKDFSEGYSAFKTYEEPIFDEGGRIVAADTLEVEELEQRNSDFEFDARKAVIYSTVFERKYC
jgi:hypothetical protein